MKTTLTILMLALVNCDLLFASAHTTVAWFAMDKDNARDDVVVELNENSVEQAVHDPEVVVQAKNIEAPPYMHSITKKYKTYAHKARSDKTQVQVFVDPHDPAFVVNWLHIINDRAAIHGKGHTPRTPLLGPVKLKSPPLNADNATIRQLFEEALALPEVRDFAVALVQTETTGVFYRDLDKNIQFFEAYFSAVARIYGSEDHKITQMGRASPFESLGDAFSNRINFMGVKKRFYKKPEDETAGETAAEGSDLKKDYNKFAYMMIVLGGGEIEKYGAAAKLYIKEVCQDAHVILRELVHEELELHR